MSYFRVHAEKLLYCLSAQLDADEIGCKTLLEARAIISTEDELPGIINYFNDEHLAAQAKVNKELLLRTIEKLKNLKQIKIRPLKSKKMNSLIFSTWNKEQHAWIGQKAYRDRQKERRKKEKEMIISGPKKNNHVITGDANRIGGGKEDNDKKDYKEERGKGGLAPDPSSSKGLFLLTLKEFSASHFYLFNEDDDGHMFDFCSKEYPDVDLHEELKKKIQRWEDHPEELKGAKDPRVKLFEWFGKEQAFQSKRKKAEFGED